MAKLYLTYLLLIIAFIIGCENTSVSDNSSLLPDRPAYSSSDSIPIPKLSVGVPIHGGDDISITWTQIDFINYYELEQSINIDFRPSFLIYSGSENIIHYTRSNITNYYRVRAIYGTLASQWSNIGKDQ